MGPANEPLQWRWSLAGRENTQMAPTCPITQITWWPTGANSKIASQEKNIVKQAN